MSKKNKYKLSSYAELVKISSNDYVVFSGLTGFISIISSKVASNLINNTLERLQPNDEEYLIQNGVLVFETIDEKEKLKQVIQKSYKLSNKTKNITIITTRQCNCKCSYCYQGNNSTLLNNTSIKEAQIPSIIKYIKSVSDEKELNIIFFGGEPLLKQKLIEQMIKSFRYSFSSDKLLNFSFITNGTLISNNFIELFNTYDDLAVVQVTFDGLKNSHNRIRQLKNGNGTYDLILEGLSKLILVAKKLKLRINVSKDNLEDVVPLYEFLIKSFPSTKVIPYLAPVRTLNKKSNNNELSPDEFWSILKEFYNFYYCHTKKQHPNLVPKIKYNPCFSLMTIPSWIGANNIVYQCQHQPDVGHPSSGNIKQNGELIFNPVETNLFKKYIDKKCINCKIYAFCGGPCLADLYNENPYPFHCSYLRKSIIYYTKTLTLNNN